MRICLATISGKRGSSSGKTRGGDPTGELLREYVKRSSRYAPCEHRVFASERALLEFVEAAAGRTRPRLVAADGRGEQVSSEDVAALVRRAQEDGVQLLVLAVGPADGWSPAALKTAAGVVGFGRVTLPHELAAAVAAEQVYRALTILAGHPYHGGH